MHYMYTINCAAVCYRGVYALYVYDQLYSRLLPRCVCTICMSSEARVVLNRLCPWTVCVQTTLLTFINIVLIESVFDNFYRFQMITRGAIFPSIGFASDWEDKRETSLQNPIILGNTNRPEHVIQIIRTISNSRRQNKQNTTEMSKKNKIKVQIYMNHFARLEKYTLLSDILKYYIRIPWIYNTTIAALVLVT